MKLGFVMLPEPRRPELERLQAAMAAFRPDQNEYFEHLLRSWGIFSVYDGLALATIAATRTLHERP
jgi:hypothetical protein